MQTKFVLLLGLALVLACAMTRAQDTIKPAWSQQLKGWRKLLGVIAVVLALLIVLNPEFLALGILGDTAFFDMLVLALSLQLHMLAIRACRRCVTVLAKAVRWSGIPSLGLRYLLTVSTLAIGAAVSKFQKILNTRRWADLRSISFITLCASLSGAEAQTSSGLMLQMYAGLTITGTVGTVYTVQYTTDLPPSNHWQGAGIVQLPSSPYLWIDTTVPATGRRFYRAVEGPTNMVWIPPGTFTMGSPSNELTGFNQDRPPTVVTLTRGFFMGKYEVTQGEFVGVMGFNPSFFRNGTNSTCCGSIGGVVTNELRHPVESVGPSNAMAYCAHLSEREAGRGQLPPGWVYRLPTEAEWEDACRAGTTTPFSYGPTLSFVMANIYDFDLDVGTNAGGIFPGGMLGRTTVVGSYEPNGWGLYDMHGNVAEWCLDKWDFGGLPGGRVVDPLAQPAGGQRMFRGGAWGFGAFNCTSAFRSIFPVNMGPYFGGLRSTIGFRVVLAPSHP